MCRPVLSTIALSCSMFLAPFSAAAQATNPPESLCAPVNDTEADNEASISGLNLQDYNVTIDLLENGINPGFTSIPEIDNAQLAESVAQFQAANDLPVTGHLDAQTLSKLNIREPKSDPASSAVERAKPSK